MTKTLVLKVSGITAVFAAVLLTIGAAFPSNPPSPGDSRHWPSTTESAIEQALPEMVSLQVLNPAGAAPKTQAVSPQAVADWEMIDALSMGVDVPQAPRSADWEIIDGAEAGYAVLNG